MPVFGSIGVDHHLPLDARARVEPHWTGARRRAPWLHRSPVEQPGAQVATPLPPRLAVSACLSGGYRAQQTSDLNNDRYASGLSAADRVCRLDSRGTVRLRCSLDR